MRILHNQHPSDNPGDELDLVGRDVALLEKAGEEKGGAGEIPELPEKLDESKLADEVKEELEAEKLDETLAEVPVEYHTSFKTINDKYPNFFKEFKDFREIVGRHAEFTKIFPTVNDATDAFERAEEFDQIEDAISNGNLTTLLESIKEAAPDKFNDLLLQVLPYVADKDPKGLYVKMTAPVIDIFIKALYQAGLANRNEDIQNAALQAAHWGFGNEEYATGKLSIQQGPTKPDPERVKFEEEKRQYLTRKYNDTQLSVSAFIEKKLRARIDEGLQNIPNGFTRRKIIDDVWELIQDNLESDTRHTKSMDTMWKKAARTSFDDEWKSRIITAMLSRTLPMIPGLRNKVVAEALGQSPQKPDRIKIKGDDANLDNLQKQSQVSTVKGVDPRKIDRQKTSDLDILEGRITLKGK